MLGYKDKNRQTGNKQTVCPFHEEIDAILATRATSQPVVVMENFGVTTANSKELLDG